MLQSLRRAILVPLVIAGATLGGCSSVDETLSVRMANVPLTAAPRYGDSDPVEEWEGGAPHGFPVHGIDVSKFQGTIDWPTVRNAGIAFAFIKATEGGDLVDDRFAENWAGARRAGMPRSAYHFYYFCRPAIEQFDWFVRNVPRERGTLPHVLDMEWNAFSPTCQLRPPPEVVRREMRIFLDRMERHYGKRPIIYTTVDFHAENFAGHVPNEVFWLRSVAAHPRVTYPGRRWLFWQYTGTGLVPGIEGDTDINVFAGTRSDWRDWLETALR